MSSKKTDSGRDSAAPDFADDPVIGQLKDMYDSVAKEPLPEDLLHLLGKLDEAERAR